MPKSAAIALGALPFVMILAGAGLVGRGHRRTGIWLAVGGVTIAALLWVGVVVMGG